MKLNSAAAIAQGRRDLKRYGTWDAVFAAATRREDGVLVLPPDPPTEEELRRAGWDGKTKR
jgi:hypothetical protein